MRSKVFSIVVALVAGALLAAGTSYARDVTATITVLGSALVFEGAGLMPPDATGHFAVGIKLPQAEIKARNCEMPYLVLGVGTLNKPEAQLTSDDKKVVAKNGRLFSDLTAAAANGATVTVPLRNTSQYLSRRGNTVTANYCSLSIDQEKLK